MSDKEIIRQVLVDPQFFHCIMMHYEKRIRRFIFRYAGLPKADIDDILQESYIRIFRNLREFDFDLKFQNWVYRIARNMTVDYLRKNKKFRGTVSLTGDTNGGKNLIDELVSNDDIGAFVEAQFDLEKLATIVESLPAANREIAILRFWEEKDYGEIGDIIRKPTGTVGSLVNRTRKMIIERYKKGEL